MLKKTIDKWSERLMEFVDKHQNIGLFLFMAFFGYIASMFVVSEVDCWGDSKNPDEENPLSWAFKWFLVIVLGTLIEGLFVCIAFGIGFLAMILLSIVCLAIANAYVYLIPLVFLFLILYFGRKVYLRGNSTKE